MDIPKIFADFNNADKNGKVRLNTSGSLKDIQRLQIDLKEGMEILLDDQDGLVTMGQLGYSEEEKIWVAEINWDNFKD